MNGLHAGYVALFGLTAILCVVCLSRLGDVRDAETRRGMRWLLVLSGGWAGAHVGYLLAPTATVAEAFYLLGLVVGLATVGPWLYLCSAFTGRSIHRRRGYRQVAVGTFLLIVALKLSNPIHERYYTTESVTTPFPHLLVTHEPLHWVIMGLAYALSFVGFFMLLELLTQVNHDTRPLLAILALTGAPVVLDLVGAVHPMLIDTTHASIGVAAFAVGVLFVSLEQFERVRLAGRHDEPIIALDADDRIRDFNDAAARRFPALRGGGVIGEPFRAVLPTVAEALGSARPIIERERAGHTRYYRLSETPIGTSRTTLGRIVTVTDVTDRERYRRELERQNDRLEQFASMLSHDLRNPLSVAQGHLEAARATGPADWPTDTDHLAIVAESHERMEALIEDVLVLARHGQPIDEPSPIDLSTVAERSWAMVATGNARLDLEIDEPVQFQADPERFQQVLENLYRNAIEHGGQDVTVRVGPIESERQAAGDVGRVEGIFVEDDGAGIPAADRETVFDSGYTTADHGTGFGLAIVAEIVEAHGWDVSVTESDAGGARFEIRGVGTTASTTVAGGA